MAGRKRMGWDGVDGPMTKKEAVREARRIREFLWELADMKRQTGYQLSPAELLRLEQGSGRYGIDTGGRRKKRI